ncbi:MAG: hypothetical protein J6W84_00320, partial [Bacteroidales bacterium]|nr:hypothetical protein [Bacteroidales bacterium]
MGKLVKVKRYLYLRVVAVDVGGFHGHLHIICQRVFQRILDQVAGRVKSDCVVLAELFLVDERIERAVLKISVEPVKLFPQIVKESAQGSRAHRHRSEVDFVGALHLQSGNVAFQESRNVKVRDHLSFHLCGLE